MNNKIYHHALALLFLIIILVPTLIAFAPTDTTSTYVVSKYYRGPTTHAVYTRSSSQLEQVSTFDRQRQRRRRQHQEEEDQDSTTLPNIVLVAGFESFNKELYVNSARALGNRNIQVFADNEIRISPTETNPIFAEAVMNADVFVASLLFDYDDVMAVEKLLPYITGPKLLFECATELMAYNEVGTFNMKPNLSSTGKSSADGPPPAVKAILSQFSSGKEEDKIAGYVKLLKFGPDLLQFVPGEKASDLKIWLEAYRYWNQGGSMNVQYMFDLLQKSYSNQDIKTLPKVVITPDIGLLHPLRDDDDNNYYFKTPKEFLQWRYSDDCLEQSVVKGFDLAPKDAPKVAMLLYRKHVITNQQYVMDLITLMEENGICPIPIFINGVEGHTIVRDLLTSEHEIAGVTNGSITRDDSFELDKAVSVDAIVNTIGFPLVGGPAGSMEAGRNVAVAEKLLKDMNVPYLVASPLLLQSIEEWKKNGVLGLQSVVLYSLPELDGAIDTVVLGGLVGDKIALVDERVRKLVTRIKGWVELRRTPKKDRKVAIMVYGFPPNVGAVGTAALLDVPQSIENMLLKMHDDGYDVGDFARDPDSCGESIVAALTVLSEESVIASGAKRMNGALASRIDRATKGDKTTPETLAKPRGGLGSATVRAKNLSFDDLENVMGKYMTTKVRKVWSKKDHGPGTSSDGGLVVSGIQVGNVWIAVQPLLGFEGDPMRLLFQRDLTPHPQYCACYEFMGLAEEDGGIGSQAVIHLGMHGTVEWLPGQPLGNDRQSWSDELLGGLPNIYVYAANNPSESVLAKRRGYGTLVSYNVPPYGRAGLYLELANLKDLIGEYRTGGSDDLKQPIWSTCQRCGIQHDCPLYVIEGSDKNRFNGPDLPGSLSSDKFDMWIKQVADYLELLQERLFSSGLHVLGEKPSNDDLRSYLSAYYGDALTKEDCEMVLDSSQIQNDDHREWNILDILNDLWKKFDLRDDSQKTNHSGQTVVVQEAKEIVSLLNRNTEELDGVLNLLDGGYLPPAPGGDLLRDGTSVLPTGRNIHALDPYRMPAEGAWVRGKNIAEETIRQHLEANNGAYPETIACTLWGLDTIKTRGESIAIVLALVGAKPMKEGTGRVVRFDLIPLGELNRPRIDVLASLSGIFRDSFANIVDLLDDMFERCATLEEPIEMNFIRKHTLDLIKDGVDRPAARLFSNPPGDYGSMVNEVVGSGDWDDSESLGETWKSRNVFSYGRNECTGGGKSGTARPDVLDKLLTTTERIVQEIDSVEYGLTDIQEYYANTGALKKAAENRKPVDEITGEKKAVTLSVVEAFYSPSESDENVVVKDVEDILRLEYRSKLLNPKWRDAMIDQGSGGAYEVSQRMTAMVGWAATANVDNFVFDEAAERYALDDNVARKLQRSNPEAYKNVIRRLLEANGRGMWETNDDTIDKLRELYSDADDMVEQVRN